MKKAKQKSGGLPADIQRRSDRDRRVRQSDRIARVMGVLNLVQSRGRWNAKAMAAELGCSERTIYRDLEVLEFAGVPWFFDEQDQCYRVRPDYRFPNLMLSDEEVLGQAMATVISKAPGLDIGVGASPTTRKLAASTPDETKQLLADAARMVEVFELKLADHSQHSEIIKTIQYALLNRMQIAGIYESPYEPAPIKLTIHPYRLCLVKQAWYVVGKIDGETDAKTFRVARFKSLRMLDQVAEVPEKFSLREHFGNAWAVYRGEDSYDIELRFESTVAKLVTETLWHPTQQVKTHGDGRISLSFKVDGLNEIVRWILGWSGRVKVVKPEKLKLLLLETLEQAIELNSKA